MEGKQFGSYSVIKLLSTGNQSAVFEAEHIETKKQIVLRVITITTLDFDKAVEECSEILHDLMNLTVPHIVKIEDYGIHNSMLYIALTNMTGGSLGDRMKHRLKSFVTDVSRLPSPGEILHLLRRVSETLDSIHSLGIVHGQFGPGSIMFDDKGEGYIADIGLTRLMKIIFKLESTNSFNMNPYSAPELWNGERPEPATDQYAIACLVYELLTGKPPFDDTSIFNLMNAHMNDVATPPHYVRDDMPGGLANVFWQALAKPTDRRFKSVTAFCDGFEKALGDNLGERTDFFTYQLPPK